jgi:hypothetical protein
VTAIAFVDAADLTAEFIDVRQANEYAAGQVLWRAQLTVLSAVIVSEQ